MNDKDTKDSLAKRMKRYEAVSHYTATARTPLIIRVDGRAFHSFTRSMDKPFDRELMEAMVNAAHGVAIDMQGFKAAYVQSDEATFCLTDYDNLTSQGWFGYELTKVVSTSAALMTVWFSWLLETRQRPTFDSRAFNVPRDDVVNMFLWRAKDWERNSLQMYARSFFSHRSLHGKKREDIHEMLHGIGKNWATDLSPREKNGTFLINTEEGIVVRDNVLPRYNSISEAFEGLGI